jgi:hypothetical protein
MKSTMRGWVIVLVLVSFGSAFAQGGGRKGGRVELDVRDLAAEAKVSLKDAMATAVKAKPGRVVSAVLAGRSRGTERRTSFDVAIVAEGKPWLVEIDPALGSVIAIELMTDAEESGPAMKAAAMLKDGTPPLYAAIDAASIVVKGKPVAIGWQPGPAGLRCEVRLVEQRYMSVAVLGSDMLVMAIGLAATPKTPAVTGELGTVPVVPKAPMTREQDPTQEGDGKPKAGENGDKEGDEEKGRGRGRNRGGRGGG